MGVSGYGFFGKNLFFLFAVKKIKLSIIAKRGKKIICFVAELCCFVLVYEFRYPGSSFKFVEHEKYLQSV